MRDPRAGVEGHPSSENCDRGSAYGAHSRVRRLQVLLQARAVEAVHAQKRNVCVVERDQTYRTYVVAVLSDAHDREVEDLERFRVFDMNS